MFPTLELFHSLLELIGIVSFFFFRSLRPLVVTLIPGNEKEIIKIKNMRAQLSEELSGVISQPFSFLLSLYRITPSRRLDD